MGVVAVLLGLLMAPVSPAGNSRVRTASTGGGPGGGGNQVNVTLNATDAPSFMPHGFAAPAGDRVALRLVNHGGYDHTFTLVSNGTTVLPRTLSPTQLYRYFQNNVSWVNISLPPAATRWVNLTVPASDAGGSYEFVSVIPYQFQAGMFGFFNVTGAPTGPGVVLQTNATTGLSFVPNLLGVQPAHYPVAVDVLVTNVGSLPHTFTIESQPNVTLSSTSFYATFKTAPPAANVSVPNPGSVAWANFSVPRAGVYEFICEVAGHFANGMFGFLYIGVPVPVISAPSSAIVAPVLLEGGGAVLGLGVLLVIAATLTGRFPERAPASHPPH
ncbi:MAG: hypothetical protein L3K15_03375 [Thermoplasmata archaeon]|nr:hypothetical protein [Thermoplasmata archaeon]